MTHISVELNENIGIDAIASFPFTLIVGYASIPWPTFLGALMYHLANDMIYHRNNKGTGHSRSPFDLGMTALLN